MSLQKKGPAALAYEVRQMFLDYANPDDIAIMLDSDDKLYSPSVVRQIDFMALNDMFAGNASIMDLDPLPSIDLKLVEVRQYEVEKLFLECDILHHHLRVLQNLILWSIFVE